MGNLVAAPVGRKMCFLGFLVVALGFWSTTATNIARDGANAWGLHVPRKLSTLLLINWACGWRISVLQQRVWRIEMELNFVAGRLESIVGLV